MHRFRLGLFLLAALLLLHTAGCGTGTSVSAKEPSFDYYVECTTQEDVEVLSKAPFVDRLFSFTLMIFQRPGYKNPMAGQLALFAAPSFDNLDVTLFTPDCLVKEDKSILQSPEQNPILIDAALAKAEHLSVGDKFCQETNVSDEPLEFTIGAIYRHTPLFAQFEAIALINEQLVQVFSDIVEEMGYTNVYIKASDADALKTYLDTEFIPHLSLKGLSEEEIAAIPREDLDVYYEDYVKHVNRNSD